MTSRYHAVMTLLESGLNSLPITAAQTESIINSKGFSIINYDVNYSKHIEILKDMGVFALAKRVKAFTYTSKDEHIVFISSGLSNSDKRLLLAHELGHIILGHMSDNCIVGYKPGGLIDEGQEDEANAFALEFLAPVCVLDRKHITNANTISAVTLLDDKRSRLVADEIRNHKKFIDYELKLCNQFETVKQRKKSITVKLIVGISACIIVFVSGLTLYKLPLNINSNSSVAQPSESINNNTKNENMVVATKSGNKYHLSDCKHVVNRDNLIHMTIEEAQTAGYEPCEDCKPLNE